MSQLAVIFDVDGVLVDSYQAHFLSWRMLFLEMGLAYSEEEFAASFGRTSREILREKLGENVRGRETRAQLPGRETRAQRREKLGGELSDAELAELDDRKETHYRAAFRENFVPMDGAVELVNALADGGFLLGIGSSGPAANVALAVDLLELGARFSARVTGADVSRGKPDPQVFLLAAERLGIPPAGCAVVEDAVHGITAANRAGMASVGLVGTVTRERLARARLVVDSLRELSPQRMRELIGTE